MILPILTLLLEIVTDASEFRKKGMINHNRGVLFRVLTVLAIAVSYPNPIGVICFMIGLYILIFDHAMGYIIARNIHYVGNTAKMDKITRKIPVQIRFFLRIFLFAVLSSAYFYPQQWIDLYNEIFY